MITDSSKSESILLEMLDKIATQFLNEKGFQKRSKGIASGKKWVKNLESTGKMNQALKCHCSAENIAKLQKLLTMAIAAQEEQELAQIK